MFSAWIWRPNDSLAAKTLFYVKRNADRYSQDQDNEFAKLQAAHPGPQLPSFMELDDTIKLHHSGNGEWEIPPDVLLQTLDDHVHFYTDGDDDLFLSAFSHKKRARQFARRWMRECSLETAGCSIVKVRTGPGMMVYKATDLFRAFELDYNPFSFEGVGSTRLFKDQYLVAYEIPAKAIEWIKPHSYRLPCERDDPIWAMLQVPKAEIPKHLYRVVHNHDYKNDETGYGVRYHRHMGYDTWDWHDLKPASTQRLLNGLRLHLTWVDDEEQWYDAKTVWIPTFSNKEAAARWVVANKGELGECEVRLITIDTSKFDCVVCDAAHLIEQLEIPLKPGLQMPSSEDEYLVLRQIPAKAFVKEEVFPEDIDPMDLLRGLVEVSSPA